MATLKYDKTGRLLFTKEMKKEYTLLMPQMLPVSFAMMKRCFEMDGYKAEILDTTHRAVVDTGLKYVHNDTCYPALLVIGQLIEALESGRYDSHKVALMITQTGGGCRASNYIHLLRKALTRAGLDYVPVVSLNLSGLDKNPGFSLSLSLMVRLIFSVVYGDMIVLLANQCRPYEVTAGDTDRMIEKWIGEIIGQFDAVGARAFTKKRFRENLSRIAADFASLNVVRTPKTRVGVVGEIYVKFAPLGNNNLESFLLKEDCEPVVPGLLDFLLFKINNRSTDVEIYGGNPLKHLLAGVFQHYIERKQQDMIDAVKPYSQFRAPGTFAELREGVSGYLGYGNKMGEGWLLPGEMLELIHSGITSIVCTQPFGCLPNHIAGKGMIRLIRTRHPEANIVAVDDDPGATRINQEKLNSCWPTPAILPPGPPPARRPNPPRPNLPFPWPRSNFTIIQ